MMEDVLTLATVVGVIVWWQWRFGIGWHIRRQWRESQKRQSN
jgi:hypothetical protein